MPEKYYCKCASCSSPCTVEKTEPTHTMKEQDRVVPLEIWINGFRIFITSSDSMKEDAENKAWFENYFNGLNERFDIFSKKEIGK